MKASELLQLIPSDTLPKVKEASKRFGAMVREAIRAETRLSFSSGIDEDERRDAIRVPVIVDQHVGFPTSFEQFQIDDEHRLAAILSAHQHTLESLRDSCAHLLDKTGGLPWKLLAEEDAGFDRKPFYDSRDSAEAMLKRAGAFNLLGQIFGIKVNEVNEDILGAYFYRADDSRGSASAEILLYWGVIGLVAQMLGVTVEGLVAVTLAHELAHAYTHMGFDIDGHRWSGGEFAKLDVDLREGLAQFYAESALRRLTGRIPDGIRAYEKLLPHQPAPYKTHKGWLKDQRAEDVRSALVRFRRDTKTMLSEFNESMPKAERP